VNADVLTKKDKIIANPNCSTIQMVVALKPLHDKYKIKRVVVSTYQSVTGTGVKAVNQLMNERKGKQGDRAYPYQIDLNLLPHIDVFTENGYTKEEMKMVNETKKIMGDDSIRVTATTVRVPVIGGHSESVNVEFERDFDLDEVRNLLAAAPGVVITDNPAELQYPMPLFAHDKDEVFVGRLRRDESQPNTLNMWVVSDNLRKGAATNAVQIAEYLLEKGILKLKKEKSGSRTLILLPHPDHGNGRTADNAPYPTTGNQNKRLTSVVTTVNRKVRHEEQSCRLGHQRRE